MGRDDEWNDLAQIVLIESLGLAAQVQVGRLV